MIKRSARDIRRRNRFDALRCVYAAAGPVSRQDIAAATGLSFATVANLTSELLDAGVLVEAGQETTGAGRPRATLKVDPRRGALIGVDISETFLHVELFDLSMTTRHEMRHPLPERDSKPDEVIEHLEGLVSRLLRTADVRPEQVLGIGVSVPGQVEPEGGMSVFSPYWAWHDVPFRAMLAERLKMPLFLDNPLKAATVAEMWFGAGRGVDDLVVITLRTGVGAGVAVDGTLLRGATNSAGEWGHTCLVLDGRPCRCGSSGCVETYVGAPGIMRTLAEIDPDSTLLHPDDQAATVEAIARAADAGDEVALAVVAKTGRYLGAAVGNLINMFNPQVLVLSDWVAATLGERLLRVTREVAADHALAQAFGAVDLRLCALPHNPVSLGAATFALEGFLNDHEIFGSVSSRRPTSV